MSEHPAPSSMRITQGAAMVVDERMRQVNQEGFSLERDRNYTKEELVNAAIAYALPDDAYSELGYIEFWPNTWPLVWYKPTTRIRDLTKAAALLIAEIDRLLAEEHS